MGRKQYKNETFTKLFNEGLFFKYSIKELEEMIGVSRSTIKTWRDGTSFPDVDKLVKISNLLNVSVDYLLGLSDCNSLDGNIQSASRITGLSDAACKVLINNHTLMDEINHLLIHPQFIDAMKTIRNAKMVIMENPLDDSIPEFEIDVENHQAIISPEMLVWVLETSASNYLSGIAYEMINNFNPDSLDDVELLIKAHKSSNKHMKEIIDEKLAEKGITRIIK